MSSEKHKLVELRRHLHRIAEVSGAETETAAAVVEFLREFEPDQLVTGLGGTGVAAVYDSEMPGPRVLIRCELDALPIPETLELEYASSNGNVSHKCGHDGHMAIVAGLAPKLHRGRPRSGSVILMFQPAEETGKGALQVLRDPKFESLAPDYVFALHNLPGYKLGQVILRENVFAAASNGLIIRLWGATSHAAEPEKGKSPALAVAQLIQTLSSAPQFFAPLHEPAKVTVIHAQLGEVAFGTSPGEGVVMATVRTHSDRVMKQLAADCAHLAQDLARTWKLEADLRWNEEFPVTVNHSGAVKTAAAAAETLGLETFWEPAAFPWSEDFGHFTSRYPGAIFGLGSGSDQPALHHPHYDFPEQLIAIGLSLFTEIIRRQLDWEIEK